jgi:hypothetical protein
MKHLVCVFTGLAVVLFGIGLSEAAPFLTGELEIISPISKSYLFGTDFTVFQEVVGPPLHPAGAVGEATGLLEFVNLGEAGDFSGFTSGHIALIQRGLILFSDKILNAEAAGALAVVIFNSGAGLPDVVLEDSTSIPAVFTTLDVGQELQNLLAQGEVTVFVKVAPVPEPSTWLLLGIGSLGLIGVGYRRRRKAGQDHPLTTDDRSTGVNRCQCFLLTPLCKSTTVNRHFPSEEDTMSKTFRVLVFFLAVMGGSWSSRPADALTLLLEDFNDVTGLTSPTSGRPVANILTTTPTQLPPGTTTTGSTTPQASHNVRRGDNLINSTAPPPGFGNFFMPTSLNNFLVLGDNAGGIGGGATGGTSQLNVPFMMPLPLPIAIITVDWMFQGGNTPVNDSFQVFVDSNELINTTVLGGISGDSFRLPLLPGIHTLSFILNEATGGATNTAAGIDNIRIDAVIPEPSTYLLFAVGLLGLIGRGYRQRKKAVEG